VRLSQEEARVIGSLIEKQLTTPQQYPLTLNALLLACNQSSNRDPVVEWDEPTVENSLAALKAAGLVRFDYPSHGRSVTRYQQLLPEHLALTDEQLALVAVLLLRGPQTSGELRSRTERMCEFGGIAQVDLELEDLSGRTEPVVARLPRRTGQKEERWVQLLTGDWEGGPGEPEADVPVGGTRADLRAVVAELRVEVAELGIRVAQLQAQLETLRRDGYPPTTDSVEPVKNWT
jgi:uncharacterized protein YceH (UPF0502 family)